MRHKKHIKYEQNQRRNPGHSSKRRNYHDIVRRSRSISKTSNFNRASHEKEVRGPELDSDIDVVSMDILPNFEPWKGDVTAKPELSFEPISDSEYGFPNHCWVGEYLDGVEKDITPLSHDTVAKEILERQYWNAEPTNSKNVYTDHSTYQSDTNQCPKLHSEEFQQKRTRSESISTDPTLDFCVERKMGTEVGASYFSHLNNYDDPYNSLIQPEENISVIEEQRVLLQEQTLAPNTLAKVYGGDNAKNTLPSPAKKTVFEDTHYDTFPRISYNPDESYARTQSHSIKIDDVRKEYLQQSLTQGYSFNDNENSLQSHKSDGTPYKQATDVDGCPRIEYSELSDYDKKIESLASSTKNRNSFNGVTVANIEVPASDNTKSTKRGYPIPVLSTRYHHQQYLEEKIVAETRNSPLSPRLPGSNNILVPLKVESIFEKNAKNTIQSDQYQRGSENMSSADTGSFSSNFFKGSFIDTHEVLLNENKESSHRIEDDPETLSHDRIVVKFQHNDDKDMVRKKLCSTSCNEANASEDLHHTEKISYQKKFESNFHSPSVFPFFQDAEDVNRKSDGSEGSYHSRSFQRQSIKHSTVSPPFKSYSPSYLSAKHMNDNTERSINSTPRKPTELKRKLNSRNFNQLGPDPVKSTEKQSSKRFDDDITHERRSSSGQLSDADERKSEDTRKFGTKSNLEMNIDCSTKLLNEFDRYKDVFHTPENSSKRKIGYTCDQKEPNDETSIKISSTNDGSQSFNKSVTMQDVCDSTRIGRNADTHTSRTDIDDLVICDMNISPSSSPNIRGPDRNRLAIYKTDKLNDEQNIATTNKRFIETTKLYEEKHAPLPWLQEYEIWFNELIRPILDHDKYARDTGLINHLIFLKSVTEGNRKSLSYIPRGVPAKQILKFVALNKNGADSEISKQFTVDTRGIMSPYLDVNNWNPFETNGVMPAHQDLNNRNLFNTYRDMNSPHDVNNRNPYETNKDMNSHYDANSRNPFTKSRVMNSPPDVNSKNSYSLSDSPRHVWNKSVTRSSQSSISATYELTMESKNPDSQFPQPLMSLQNLSPSFVKLGSKKESNKSLYIDELLSEDETPDLANKNFVPDKYDGAPYDAKMYRHKERHSMDETYDTTSSCSRPFKTNIRKKFKSNSTTHVKKATEGYASVSRWNSSKARHHSTSGDVMSKNADNKLTTGITKSNHKEERVAKSTSGSRRSSDKKTPTGNKDSKNVTGGQHELQRNANKKNSFSKFTSIDSEKVSCRAVDFRGGEYTCINIPDSKPSLTAEQKRLLPLFKKQVENCVIQRDVNVLFEFEKYRIARIFEVGTDILEQFEKSHRTSEFTAHHAIYYIWCLFEDPTTNVLDELTRKLRKLNLDKPHFLEDMDTFMLFQRTVFNMCYDQLNPNIWYSEQTSHIVNSVRFRSENFFPQFYGESHIIMKLWSWYERMCSLYDNIGATKKDAKWRIFPEYHNSSKSLEEKVAIWLKKVLKGRLYRTSEAFSINIVREVDCQFLKKDSRATKEKVVMLVVRVWLQNYFKEECKSLQHNQEHHQEMDVDVSNEISNLLT